MSTVEPDWSGPDWTGPDWTGIGLALAILGMCMLANALLFRPTKSVVREAFGERKYRLRALREKVFQRAQITVGFTFLLAGLCAQLFGRYQPVAETDPRVPWPWIVGGVVAAIGCLSLAWWWCARSFRRALRDHLRASPPDFESDPVLAREVGEFFGVGSMPDDTVQSYASRLRERIGLPHFDRRRAAHGIRPEEVELEEGAV